MRTMQTIKIKPLSVNCAFQGKRFKTKDYKQYELALLSLLKQQKIPKGRLKLSIDVGFSTSNADVDNILKPFIDILQKKYKFNDRDIYEISARKNIVNKGFEYISFKIEKYTMEIV